MRVNFKISKRTLRFNFDARTSRGSMQTHTVYYLILDYQEITGIGEIAPLPGLSIDYESDMTGKIQKEVSEFLHQSSYTTILDDLNNYVDLSPSVRFGLETAVLDLLNGGIKKILDCDFLNVNGSGILINGLIWMGDLDFMMEQLVEKIQQGFRCIKFKVGAIDLDMELALIQFVREQFPAKILEIRLDANGAFAPDEALSILDKFARYEIHSIEQPIKPGQWDKINHICAASPIAIALDEELIGIKASVMELLLDEIGPDYIILKPTLLGGLNNSKKWIEQAESQNIGWWVTSALESNVGLNAIAQFCSSLKTSIPQGLGTGGLYSNNIESPLQVISNKLFYNPDVKWSNINGRNN